MTIVTITTITMYILCAFISAMCGVFKYSELIIAMFLTLPTVAFCKKWQKPLNVFYALMSASHLARLVVLPACVDKMYTFAPISVNDEPTEKIIGLITVITLLTYYAVLYLMCYLTIKNTISKTDTYEKLTHSMNIQNALNLFNSSTVVTIFSLLLCLFGYSLGNHWINISGFIMIIIVVSLTFQVQVINDIRDRKEYFLDKYKESIGETKKDEDLEIIEIEVENGSRESKE